MSLRTACDALRSGHVLSKLLAPIRYYAKSADISDRADVVQDWPASDVGKSSAAAPENVRNPRNGGKVSLQQKSHGSRQRQ